MKNRRDLFILLVLFAALVAFTILGPGATRDETFSTRPTTYSSGPGGALALLRWAEALGYDAQRLEFTAFELDAQSDALLILNPSVPINRTEAGRVLDWVDAGGTLILVDDRARLLRARNELLPLLEVDILPYEGGPGEGNNIERAAVLQPALDGPPVQEARVRTSRVVVTERNDIVRLVGLRAAPVGHTSAPAEATGGEPGAATALDAAAPEPATLIGVRQGLGYIYLSSASFPFTNAGLEEEENAALVLNLLRSVPEGGRILFDEYHHGYFTPPSLRSVVLENAWGWALLYGIGILGLYLVLTGRRFGAAVPLHEEVVRRSSTEYIESMADLFQRSGKRGFILRHYYTALKRRLARPHGINPGVDDATLAAELAHYRQDDFDQGALQRLLARMQQGSTRTIGEEELLRLVGEADQLRTRRA